MKILINPPLLTIVFFLHFEELNASGDNKARSSSRVARGGYIAYAQKDPRDGPSHKTIQLDGHSIELWLDISRKHVLKAWYENCGLPHGTYFRKHNFLIRIIEVERLKLVAYISDDKKLIGVRAPKQPGQSYRLEPNPRVSYLIYASTTFMLKVDPKTDVVEEIKLMPKNNYEAGHRADHVEVAGLKFTVFTGGPLFKITGAVLNHV